MTLIRAGRPLVAGFVAAASLAIAAASPAAAHGDLAPTPAEPTRPASIVEFFNMWSFCEDTWLVALDQMYPDDFSVGECMDVIEAHDNP